MSSMTFVCSSNSCNTIAGRSEHFASDQLCCLKISTKNYRKEVCRVNYLKWPLRFSRRLRVLCEAYNVQSHVVDEVLMHENPATSKVLGSKGVPVFVMLPLDTVNANGTVKRKRAMNASLMALKSAGVKGVMVDVWWGLVEKDGPCNYNWSRYKERVCLGSRGVLVRIPFTQ